MVVLEDKKEVEHVIKVLKDAQTALRNNNSMMLQQLSDQTIHSASITQHTDFITIAVLIYSLNKLILNRIRMPIRNWDLFVRKVNDELSKAITELRNEDSEEFARHLEHCKELLKGLSPNLRPDVEDVIQKASLNKASKIYEHGISLAQTSRLLDVSQWDLLNYVGQRTQAENPLNKTLDVKKRAKMAMEFIS